VVLVGNVAVVLDVVVVGDVVVVVCIVVHSDCATAVKLFFNTTSMKVISSCNSGSKLAWVVVFGTDWSIHSGC
jgi:hypothetical protein